MPFYGSRYNPRFASFSSRAGFACPSAMGGMGMMPGMDMAAVAMPAMPGMDQMAAVADPKLDPTFAADGGGTPS